MQNILHWPVIFLYEDVLQSDYIRDMKETDTFISHLREMFPPKVPSYFLLILISAEGESNSVGSDVMCFGLLVFVRFQSFLHAK